jgi:outer membrane protein OmpA-like peptidoglycan-associated protein
MCRRLVLVLAACSFLFLAREQTAEPCGVKLNIKAPRVKKQSDRSGNPSQILLLGDPPRSLSKELSSRGHKVEVAGSADEARRVKYHAIVADSDHEEEARTRWPGALVVVRRGSARADANLVDQQLGTSPKRTLVARIPERTSRDERAPVRTGPPREDSRGAPVAAGGGGAGGRSLEASGSGSADTEVATDAPDPGAGESEEKATAADTGDDEAKDEAVAADTGKETGKAAGAAGGTRVAAAVEAEPAEETEEPEKPEKRADRGPAGFHRNIFFSFASADLSIKARKKLARNVRWLKRHPNRAVTIEGHASVSGPPAPNKALSEARAQAVKAYLIRRGIKESRIETAAFGLSKPAFKPGWNPKNRRVSIKIEKK